MSAVKRVIVYGGKGALGSECVSYFMSQKWWVGSVDLVPNDNASVSIALDVSDSWEKQQEKVTQGVEDSLKGDKVDAILCVAGGWAGGNAASKDIVKNSDMMWKQSVWSSIIAANLATKFLKEGGLLQLTGAQPATAGTPGMIGYGMAKAAVHQLVKSLAGENSGLPQNAFVGAILPVTLNTPMNRKWMADADQSSWTPLTTVAELLYGWAQGEGRPDNGSLVQLLTKNGETQYVNA